MHTLLLAPTDVLFFRDGRPMTGSLAGHTAAWPLPNIGSAALHAALWRAGFAESSHVHRRARSGKFFSHDREKHGERFGTLATAGPFPVDAASNWFFPRPLDAIVENNKPRITLRPTRQLDGASSLRVRDLSFAVANTMPPTKAAQPRWWSESAWSTYLGTPLRGAVSQQACFKADADLADTETQIGIQIDAATGTTGQGEAAGKIYSAHYLRLREGWQLGLFAKANDKEFKGHDGDLITALLDGGSQHIIVGGQQRVCSASFASSPEASPAGRLPLPFGKTENFATAEIEGKARYLVKWVLLSPAIWPEIAAGVSARGTKSLHHLGGWLPNWIEPGTLRVLLRTVSGEVRRQRRRLNSDGRGYASADNASAIGATLVAALVPKPIVVTGWSLGASELQQSDEADMPGAKPTHLAVPAGAIYYFAADSAEDARDLATALNWHGDTPGKTITHRRSTLLGEKGFGLGVCGTWRFHGEAGH